MQIYIGKHTQLMTYTHIRTQCTIQYDISHLNLDKPNLRCLDNTVHNCLYCDIGPYFRLHQLLMGTSRLVIRISTMLTLNIMAQLVMYLTRTTLIDNLYIKMKQPGQLASGILNIDISNHLPIFTFIVTQMCANRTTTDILCRPMDDDKITNITNELNNIDLAIIDHFKIDDAYVIVSKIQSVLKALQKQLKFPIRKYSRTKSIMHTKCFGKLKESQAYQILLCTEILIID